MSLFLFPLSPILILSGFCWFLLLFTHFDFFSRSLSLVIISTFSLPHFFTPPPSPLPPPLHPTVPASHTDIVMLLHTTLSRLKRWSHEWSLQFKSTQPSRRLKWIFCIYSCNNDSIWGYYLQTLAEFSAALITERRRWYQPGMKNVLILTCLEWTGAIN